MIDSTKDDAPRTALVTGVASGIGRATAEALEAQGVTVIGVDLRGADVNADLGSTEGLGRMISEAERLAPDGLDIVVAAAGISRPSGGMVVAVNYFGARGTIEGLRPLLARKARSSAIAVCSAAAIQDVDEDILAACLTDDRTAALALATDKLTPSEYATSKRALMLWMRGAAISPQWGGSDIFLNAVAPGFTLTGMTLPTLGDPETVRQRNAATPRAFERAGQAEDLAEVIVALANLRGGYLLGQIIYVDGGTDAIRRPDRF